ncbi:MAG: hypothetical protein HS101_01745 [Planctomycetia bacterium]|nr:hypothetical protein [Planctomycetia bacterium]MCC7315768.1 hypothetical protein [Planctomycetota bacterium]
MSLPGIPIDANDLSAWSAVALEYLRDQLANDAPTALGKGKFFPNSPLEGEGFTVIFPFQSQRGAPADTNFYVAVGPSHNNYYPAYGLAMDEAYDLHLGTRFMLVMGIALRSPVPDDDFEIQREARRVVDRIAPQAVIDDLELAASFDVDGQFHAVLRCKMAGRPVYIFAGDAPIGFSEKISLSPAVAYRIQLGRVLRHEAKPDDD